MMDLLIATSILVSQSSWGKAYGRANWEDVKSIVRTADGGYVAAGEVWDPAWDISDFLVLKVNSSGNLVWTRTFYGSWWYDWAYSIIPTYDNGFAIAGVSYLNSSTDFAILKLNSDGSLAWSKAFGGTEADYAHSIMQTPDGGYTVAGYTYSYGAGGSDFLVLKLNSYGSLAWARTFGGTSWERAHSIDQTGWDAGYVIAGTTMSFGAGDYDILVLKLNSDGSFAWAKTYGGTGTDYAYSITYTAAGFLVAGATRSFGAGDWDFLVLNLDLNGNLVWAKTYGGTGYDFPAGSILTSDGGYAIVGTTRSFSAGSEDFLILKLNWDGSVAWARVFGGTREEQAKSMIQTSDGGYAVAGYTYSFGAGFVDCLILKLDGNGDYPGCINSCWPTVTTPSISVSTLPTASAACSPATLASSYTVSTPSFTIANACSPTDVKEVDLNESKPGITCSPVPGGALFLSPENMPIRIHAVDGRVAYSGNLEKGENRITLDQGVYLWRAGECGGIGAPAYPMSSGKAVVR